MNIIALLPQERGGITDFVLLTPLFVIDKSSLYSSLTLLTVTKDMATAGLILIIYRSTPVRLEMVDSAKVETALTKCQEVLAHMATFSQSARQTMNVLDPNTNHLLGRDGKSQV
jgi:hypothetical protein